MSCLAHFVYLGMNQETETLNLTLSQEPFTKVQLFHIWEEKTHTVSSPGSVSSKMYLDQEIVKHCHGDSHSAKYMSTSKHSWKIELKEIYFVAKNL